MASVRHLQHDDVRAVVERIVRQLGNDALVQPLVNADLDRDILYDTMLHATNSTWVAVEDDRVVGHLFAAVLPDSANALAAWTGPDGASFDNDGVLDQLTHEASASWRRAGATHHYSWTLCDDMRIDSWRNIGYEPLSVRGAMKLCERARRELPPGMELRAARSGDIDQVLELDHVIDLAQGESKARSRKDRHATRREILELLDDPEVTHYVVDQGGRVLAQAITFPLPTRRGSFDATLHLSEVVVDPSAQGQGVASAMIDAVLDHARRDGFSHVEAQWRLANEQANSFWPRYGLTPTYVRLSRALSLGE